jgi:hypothetical protein
MLSRLLRKLKEIFPRVVEANEAHPDGNECGHVPNSGHHIANRTVWILKSLLKASFLFFRDLTSRLAQWWLVAAVFIGQQFTTAAAAKAGWATAIATPLAATPKVVSETTEW